MKKCKTWMLCSILALSLCTACGNTSAPAVENTNASETETQKETIIPRETPSTEAIAPAEAFAGGTGTKSDPYQIADASQLALLGKLFLEEAENNGPELPYSEAHYILTSDIQLNDTTDFASWKETAPTYGWEPIGYKTTIRFTGTLDGQNHTISGLYMNIDGNNDEITDREYGLFSEVNGTIKNLNITQSYLCLSGQSTFVGAFAGSDIMETAVIENCTSDAIIDIYDESCTGGLIGHGSQLSNCKFSGTITQLDDAWSHMGGISGDLSTIKNCVNTGTISGKGYSGGISGWSTAIADSINEGSISGDTSGGITGNIYITATGNDDTKYERRIKNCINKGLVQGTNLAGGITGTFSTGDKDASIYISNCENFGEILSDKKAAGIVAQLAPEQADIMRIENCINHSDITGKDQVSGIVCDFTGNILHQSGQVAIVNCENLGAITSTEGLYASGILNYLILMGEEIDLNLSIEHCTNAGDITSPNSAGGILAFSESEFGPDSISKDSNICIKDCSNTGNITGLSPNSFVGGIAGNICAKGLPTVLENCKNTGDISLSFVVTEESAKADAESDVYMTLSQMAGGIVGRIGNGLMLTTDHDKSDPKNVNAEKADILLKNCSNSGQISVPDCSQYKNKNGKQIYVNFIGGLIGYTSAEDDYAFRADDCTYSGADRGLGNTDYPDTGKAMTK